MVVDTLTIESIVGGNAELARARGKRFFDTSGVPFTSGHSVGDAPSMVASVAEEQKANFIYVGARGIGAIQSAVLGSTRKPPQVGKTPIVIIRAD